MTSRAPPPALGRLIFGGLFVFSLVAPICLWILASRTADPERVLALSHIWSVALALLLVWAAVYIKDEPRLARIALCFGALVFAFITVRARIYSTRQLDPPTMAVDSAQPSQSARPSASQSGQTTKSAGGRTVAKVPKSDKIEDAIVGKWQLSAGKDTIIFLKDKTFVLMTEDGNALFGRYLFLDPNRLQCFFFEGNSDDPIIYADLILKDDILSRAGKNTKITYRRLDTYEDSPGITGLWQSSDGSPTLFCPDGTFVYGRKYFGTWEVNGRQVVARTTSQQGTAWTYTLSADGRTLSGPWTNPNGQKGDATLTRPSKIDKLADYMIGRWQSVGTVDTIEYRRDGTVLMTGEKDPNKFGFKVPDEDHIQISVKDGNMIITLPPWRVVRVDDNIQTTTSKAKPRTYVRVRYPISSQ